MKNQKQIVSEDNLTISRSSTQFSTAEGEYTTQIPVDLLIDIFLRVPSKSIARFRCVTKSWASILGRPYFTELFLTKSLNHPRLLFIVRRYGKLFFFSSPQTHNPDNANLSLVATRYRTHSLNSKYQNISLLHGLVCSQERRREYKVTRICNPVTGEFTTLPKLMTHKLYPPYLGYDPIDKQYKVLYVHVQSSGAQVLTLETGKLLWRMIDCQRHCPVSDHGICIDGVLYYRAIFNLMDSIVCVDVRTEKFSFINIDDERMTRSVFTLINYKGKLGAVEYTDTRYLWLWLLEDDAGKNKKWSTNMYELPLSWNDPYASFDIVGMTGTCDIVLSPYFYSYPFYVFYYNVESKTLARVEIQGLQEFKSQRIYTYPDYVEDVKLMKNL